MPRLPRLCLAALLCLGLSTPPAHASDAAIELYLRAHLAIAADGTVQAIEWGKERKIPEVVRTKLEERIRTWSFEPGAVDGRPAETRSTLRLRLTAEPVAGGDGAYQIRVDNAATGPSMSPMRTLEYPMAALRAGVEGKVLAQVRVDPDGSRHVEVTVLHGQAYRKLFERAVREALAATDVTPESVGGHTVAARFAIPVEFCLTGSSGRVCKSEWAVESDHGTSIPTTAPGAPVPQGSVARLVTDVRGTGI